MTDSQFANKSIVIAVHQSLPQGPAHELRSYLLDKKVSNLLFITHPLLNMKEFYADASSIEVYKDSIINSQHRAFHWKLATPFLFIKDFIYTMLWVLNRHPIYDLFIGLDPLNAFSGIMLKKIRRVKKVVYYTIDYMTPRFSNRLLNIIYHSLDKFCVKYSDETWNVSRYMKIARRKYNRMIGKDYVRQYYVPTGVWINKHTAIPFDKVNKNKIVYIGTLRPIMGVDLLIQSIPFIVKKLPNLTLHIIGGGPDEPELHQAAQSLGVADKIIFYGWIKNRDIVAKILSDAALGLAPFNKSVRKDEVRNADPIKLKEYMQFGLPVITTTALKNYNDIVKHKCGLIVDYNPKSLSYAVVKLLTYDTNLRLYRKNALNYVKQFDYNVIFTKNLRRVLNITDDLYAS